MKNNLRAVLAFCAVCLLMGCASAPLGHPDTPIFERQMEVLNSKRDAGQITELEHAEQAASLARRLFPQDYQFQVLRDYRVLLAHRLQDGEIKRHEFDYLWSEKRAAYLAQRDQEFSAYAAGEDARRRLAIGAFANSMSNSIQRSTQPVIPPSVRCTSTPSAGALYTTCN